MTGGDRALASVIGRAVVRSAGSNDTETVAKLRLETSSIGGQAGKSCWLSVQLQFGLEETRRDSKRPSTSRHRWSERCHTRTTRCDVSLPSLLLFLHSLHRDSPASILVGPRAFPATSTASTFVVLCLAPPCLSALTAGHGVHGFFAAPSPYP